MSGMTGVGFAPTDATGPGGHVAPIVDAPAPASGPNSIAATSVLGNLARLSADQFSHYLETNADTIGHLLVSPPAASDVSQLWSGLTAVKRSEFVKSAPHVVGNLEGIPFDVRGKANALDLTQTIAKTKNEITSNPGRGIRLELARTLDTLEKVQQAATTVTGGGKRTLVMLDTTGAPRAAVVIGDIAKAKYVSYLVPGMFFSVDEQLVDWASTAQELYTEQTSWLRRLLPTRSGQAMPAVATVAWIGYQTPALMNIGGLDLATQGADALESAIAGLQATRIGNEPFISIMAHSYGSTAALLALQRDTVTVDALALLGCPGSDAQSASQLSVRNQNVFVAEANLDPVVHSAFFGSDPGSASYGASLIDVAGGTDPVDHQKLSASIGHNGYFTKGSESMRNLALIGIDEARLVTIASNGAPKTSLASGR
jgi:pimeloyl-ACP methyl ester carboxylesterase